MVVLSGRAVVNGNPLGTMAVSSKIRWQSLGDLRCLVDSRTDNADSFMREEESERHWLSEYIHAMECSRVNSSFSNLEQRI